MTEIQVVKWDGSTQPYDREKIRLTLHRYGMTEKDINHTLGTLEQKLFNGITTKEIFKIIEIQSKKKSRTQKRDLRSALGEMNSKPDFEVFIQQLLEKSGYTVQNTREIPGKCVTHEIDGIAEKEGKLYYIETKHHSKPHIRTPFIQTLAAKSKLDDIRAGYNEGLNGFDFERIIMLCNTKMTSHAETYAKCVGIQHIGWKTPDGGIENMIRQTRTYPVTLLASASKAEKNKMSNAGIVTLDDLLKVNRVKSVSKRNLSKLKDEAKRINN